MTGNTRVVALAIILRPSDGALLAQCIPEAGRAPFYRVTGAGDCLNVRESPSLSARVLVCLADDVLVGGMETPPQTVAGIEWRQVHTPGGLLGWASTEFLR